MKNPGGGRGFFQIFEMTIHSKGLKLSVAVHSCSTEVLICHSCVYHFCCCHSNSKFHVDFAKNQLFWHNSVLFSSFLHQIVGICEFGHFISILTWFCVNFRYLWTFYENSEIQDGGSKMAGQMIWCHLTSNRGCCVYYPSNIFRNTRIFGKWGISLGYFPVLAGAYSVTWRV